MKISKAGAIGTALLVAASVVGVAAPASADPTAKTITCPDYAPNTTKELDYVHKHGSHVTTYGLPDVKSGIVTAHMIYRIDGHFEEFASNGTFLGRLCFDKIPERDHGLSPAEVDLMGSGGGSSSVGHYTHTPGPGHLAGVTTRWVKWKVSVN